jgi:hypothetical protein
VEVFSLLLFEDGGELAFSTNEQITLFCLKQSAACNSITSK